jgi:hypothetical protein
MCIYIEYSIKWHVCSSFIYVIVNQMIGNYIFADGSIYQIGWMECLKLQTEWQMSSWFENACYSGKVFMKLGHFRKIWHLAWIATLKVLYGPGSNASSNFFALNTCYYNPEDRMNTLIQLWKYKISPFH